MLAQLIPATFVLERASVSLPELKWAFDSGLIGAQTVVDFAAAKLAEGSDSPLLVDLAGTTHEDLPGVKKILESLVVHPASSDELRRKWVWLLMSWLYEHQDEGDVFETIDRLYADLGYPPEMTPFGPYAPAYQAKGDPQEARKQVIREWREYLERGEKEFGVGRED
jgi:hypothetical protein